MNTILLILVILLSLYLFLLMPSLRHPDVSAFLGRYYAHRGLHDNHSDAPENSLRAFSKAVEAGYGIEFDVQLSKDKVPVIAHDFVLGRMFHDEEGNDVEGKFKDYTYEELLRYHIADSKEKIPTFPQVLECVNGRVPLIIELKLEASDAPDELCRIVEGYLKDYKGLYCVESFNPKVVYWYRKHSPETIRGQLSEDYHKENPKYKGILYFFLTNLLLNFLTKPDFIAYNHLHETNLSRRLCRDLYKNLSVAYTIKSQKELDEMSPHFDILIFDSFIPKETDSL